jgi:Putative transposase
MPSVTLPAIAPCTTRPAVHFHCCVIDGAFATGEDGQVQFAEAVALGAQDLSAVQQQVRARVLRWFARAGHLDPADARDMTGWHHGGGFSLDASARIEGADRPGLERLLRYCARPPFALERLEQLGDDQLVYRFPRPQPDGRTELSLTPLGLIERLAALIPPPRLHRHRYQGVLVEEELLKVAFEAVGQNLEGQHRLEGRPLIPRPEIIRRCKQVLAEDEGEPVGIDQLVPIACVSARALRRALNGSITTAMTDRKVWTSSTAILQHGAVSAVSAHVTSKPPRAASAATSRAPCSTRMMTSSVAVGR